MRRLGIDWLSLKPTTLVITMSVVFGLACAGYSINKNKFSNKHPQILTYYYEEQTLDKDGNWVTNNCIELNELPTNTESKRYVYKESCINTK